MEDKKKKKPKDEDEVTMAKSILDEIIEETESEANEKAERPDGSGLSVLFRLFCFCGGLNRNLATFLKSREVCDLNFTKFCFVGL